MRGLGDDDQGWVKTALADHTDNLATGGFFARACVDRVDTVKGTLSPATTTDCGLHVDTWPASAGLTPRPGPAPHDRAVAADLLQAAEPAKGKC